MRCKRCGNRIKELFVLKDNKYICRKCLVFKGNVSNSNYYRGYGEYNLKYSLTKSQNEAAQFILNEIKSKRN